MNYYQLNNKQIIRNKHAHQYYLQKDSVTLNEMISIISNSYASLETQLRNLTDLEARVSEEDKEQVKRFISFYHLMFQMIYKPSQIFSNEGFHYVLYCDRYIVNGACLMTLSNIFEDLEQEILQCDTMETVLEYVRRYTEPEYHFTVEIVLASGRIPITVNMSYVDGAYEAIKCYLDFRKETQQKWKDVLQVYDSLFWRPDLPFVNGDCVQFQLPFMKSPAKGILFCEQDENGCRYSFLYPQDKEISASDEVIDMSYLRIGLTTDYLILDWLEHAI